MKKINIALVSRSLIALLFVVAGIQKAMHFSETVSSVDMLHVPFATLATIIVIIIEVPVAWRLRGGTEHVSQGGHLLRLQYL
jgi:uncharacterized membrane protein YphA (DoxX/SURF4 family)